MREREFVRVFGHRQPAQIAQHHQHMLVDRVDVELVVLHLAGDASEQRNIAAEDAEPVHQPHGQRDALGLRQQRDETAMIVRIAPESGVDAAPGARERAQQARRTAVDAGFARQDQKGFQQQFGVALEQGFVGIEQIAGDAEMGQDCRRRQLASAPAC